MEVDMFAKWITCFKCHSTKINTILRLREGEVVRAIPTLTMQYQSQRDNSATPPRTKLTYSAQQQQSARGELFTNSQYASEQTASIPVRVEDMDNQQIMQHAVATHKDTTESAKRALQVGRKINLSLVL